MLLLPPSNLHDDIQTSIHPSQCKYFSTNSRTPNKGAGSSGPDPPAVCTWRGPFPSGQQRWADEDLLAELWGKCPDWGQHFLGVQNSHGEDCPHSP